MAPETVFSICSTIAMVGWIILIVLPGWYAADKFIIGIIITLFALVYAWMLFSDFNFSDAKKFGSLDGVMELFKNQTLVTAGWIHYLAFDLMTGLFIRYNAQKHGISHWLVIPCLLLTFMFGPVGLLLYLLLRWIITKYYFADNFNA
ncbi:MAG: ABA4-like family protein [Chitinophagaceae bacterium]